MLKSQFEKLIYKLRNWNARIDDGYNPGWSFKGGSDADYYTQMIACQRASRISKLNWYASLIQNEKYFEIHQEFERLNRENQSTYKQGAEAFEKVQELQEKMNEISSTIPGPETNFQECNIDKPY